MANLAPKLVVGGMLAAGGAYALYEVYRTGQLRDKDASEKKRFVDEVAANRAVLLEAARARAANAGHQRNRRDYDDPLLRTGLSKAINGIFLRSIVGLRERLSKLGASELPFLHLPILGGTGPPAFGVLAFTLLLGNDSLLMQYENPFDPAFDHDAERAFGFALRSLNAATAAAICEEITALSNLPLLLPGGKPLCTQAVLAQLEGPATSKPTTLPKACVLLALARATAEGAGGTDTPVMVELETADDETRKAFCKLAEAVGFFAHPACHFAIKQIRPTRPVIESTGASQPRHLFADTARLSTNERDIFVTPTFDAAERGFRIPCKIILDGSHANCSYKVSDAVPLVTNVTKSRRGNISKTQAEAARIAHGAAAVEYLAVLIVRRWAKLLLSRVSTASLTGASLEHCQAVSGSITMFRGVSRGADSGYEGFVEELRNRDCIALIENSDAIHAMLLKGLLCSAQPPPAPVASNDGGDDTTFTTSDEHLRALLHGEVEGFVGDLLQLLRWRCSSTPVNGTGQTPVDLCGRDSLSHLAQKGHFIIPNTPTELLLAFEALQRRRDAEKVKYSDLPRWAVPAAYAALVTLTLVTLWSTYFLSYYPAHALAGAAVPRPLLVLLCLFAAVASTLSAIHLLVSKFFNSTLEQLTDSDEFPQRVGRPFYFLVCRLCGWSPPLLSEAECAGLQCKVTAQLRVWGVRDMERKLRAMSSAAALSTQDILAIMDLLAVAADTAATDASGAPSSSYPFTTRTVNCDTPEFSTASAALSAAGVPLPSPQQDLCEESGALPSGANGCITELIEKLLRTPVTDDAAVIPELHDTPANFAAAAASSVAVATGFLLSSNNSNPLQQLPQLALPQFGSGLLLHDAQSGAASAAAAAGSHELPSAASAAASADVETDDDDNDGYFCEAEEGAAHRARTSFSSSGGHARGSTRRRASKPAPAPPHPSASAPADTPPASTSVPSRDLRGRATLGDVLRERGFTLERQKNHLVYKRYLVLADGSKRTQTFVRSKTPSSPYHEKMGLRQVNKLNRGAVD